MPGLVPILARKICKKKKKGGEERKDRSGGKVNKLNGKSIKSMDLVRSIGKSIGECSIYQTGEQLSINAGEKEILLAISNR